MPPVVARLNTKTLEEGLTRTPYALVRLDRSPKPVLHRGLADWFDQRFPSLFTFGLISRAEVRADALAAAFQTALGPLRGGVKDGYYLFEAGLVVGHHGGETRPETVRYSTDPADPADDPVVRELQRSSPREAEALRQLVAYFLPIVERKQKAAGFSADGTVGTGRAPTPPPPAPRPAVAPAADDPYALLGLTPAATDEQVKEAYRTQLKLNHPDKVAHLSPALQKFAEQQVLAIKHAYETILARRRGA